MKNNKNRITIRAIGHAHYAPIPAEVCREMGIEVGTLLNIETDENRVIMTPIEVDIQKN